MPEAFASGSGTRRAERAGGRERVVAPTGGGQVWTSAFDPKWTFRSLSGIVCKAPGAGGPESGRPQTRLPQTVSPCLIPGLNRWIRPMCRPIGRHGPNVDGTKTEKNRGSGQASDRASSSGRAEASGSNFEVRVQAWYCVLLIAEGGAQPPHDLPPDTRLASVACQGVIEVDCPPGPPVTSTRVSLLSSDELGFEALRSPPRHTSATLSSQ